MSINYVDTLFSGDSPQWFGYGAGMTGPKPAYPASAPAPTPRPAPAPTPRPTSAPAPAPRRAMPRTTSTPPAGFTAAQWNQLVSMSKTNSGLAALLKQFTTSLSTPQPSQEWRREMPKDNTQLLRQLSFNVGEMGMPGGYVGAVQMPSFQFGQQLPAINNPDMSKYGQAPGYGEATFYQQSMKGGMTPIAAMSPLGVPEGWNPGGTSSDSLKAQIDAYLNKIKGGSSDQPSSWTTLKQIDSMSPVEKRARSFW